MSAAGIGQYVAALRTPGAAPATGAATLVRLGQAMLGLGSLLLLVGSGRSYAVAGLVVGAVSVSQGIVGPFVSRLVDRRGQRATVGSCRRPPKRPRATALRARA